jgi:hypothetical protein
MVFSGQLHAPTDLSTEEIAPDAHLIKGWMNHIIGLDVLVKGYISCLCEESNQTDLHERLAYKTS